jgi:hypothetical protein
MDQQTPNPFTCDCTGHTFNACGPFGRAYCPSCRTEWAITKRGIRPIPTVRVGKAGRGVTDIERLFRAMRSHDSTILCSGCAARTDLVTGREGTLAGKAGVYCVLCLATRPVKVTNETDKTVKGFIKVRPVTWNNTIQRIDAETGILAIARALEHGTDPLGYGVLLDGANWDGLRVRQLPSKLLQNGKPNPDYINALRTPERIDVKGSGSYLVGCPDPWFAVASIHPDQCTCQTCKRRGSDQRVTLRYRASRRITTRNGVALRTLPRATDTGIGRQSTATVSGILGTPERVPIRVTRCAHYERTLPRATRPRPDPALRLPDMTAYQSLVWRKRGIIPIQPA